jgi:hypothetical protein
MARNEMNEPDEAALVDDLDACVLSFMPRPSQGDPLLERLVRDDMTGSRLTADRLFRTMMRGASVEGLDVLARPGDALAEPLRGGDVLLRVGLGEPGVGHAAALVDGLLHTREALTAAGFSAERSGPGLYAHVIEAGAMPRARVDRFARRIVDAGGRLPQGHLLLRPSLSNVAASFAASTDAAEESALDEAEVSEATGADWEAYREHEPTEERGWAGMFGNDGEQDAGGDSPDGFDDETIVMLDAEVSAADDTAPVHARILWPALGFPAVIAPRTPPSTSQMQEADATRCITVLVISNRPYLSKAEAAAGLRFVPWRDRHRRNIPSGAAGAFSEVDLAVRHDKNDPGKPPNLTRPVDADKEDRHGVLVDFGGNKDGVRGVTVGFAKYVRDFYRGQGMPFLHEIRVSESESARLANGLYHLFWNNHSTDEQQPSDEMERLVRNVADSRQKRFNKYWQTHRGALLDHYQHEYGSLERSYAFPHTGGPKVRAEVLHPLFVTHEAAARLTIGHITDLHVAVRNDVYEENLRRAQLAANFNNWNTSVREIYDAAKAGCDVLLLTGDLIDYGRGHWGISEANRLGDDSFYIVDRNWSLFYHLLASGDAYKKPVYTSLGNHDWRLNPYPPFAPGAPGMLSLFHNDGRFSRKQRRSVEAAHKEFVKIAHGEGHERGFSYDAKANGAWDLLREKPRQALDTLWKLVRQKQTLEATGAPTDTNIDSIAWYLLTINPFLDYTWTLPGGHRLLMIDWAEDENVLFPITIDGQEYPYFFWQASEAADPGPRAARCLTDLQQHVIEDFVAGEGAAKIIGIHAPPLGPYTDWSDVDLQQERKIYKKKRNNRGPTNFAVKQPDGTVVPFNGHPTFAVSPKNAPEGMQADYGSFDQKRSWFIEKMAEPASRGIRLIFSGHIHRNDLLVARRATGDKKISAVAGHLLTRGITPALVRNVRAPAVSSKGDIGPLYVNTTSAGPRGHWYPAPIPDAAGVDKDDVGEPIYKSVDPGYAKVELSNDGTIHRLEFLSARTPAAARAPIPAPPDSFVPAQQIAG